MAPKTKRKLKKGTLHYALEVCDWAQLATIISTKRDLDGRASMEVMNILRKNREISRINISPLQGAVSLGNYNVCKHLIEEGAVMKSESGVPQPLCLALEKRHFDIANLLINSGADVNLAFGDLLPMAFALDDKDCRVSIVKAIIDAGFPVNGIIHRSSQRTSLHSAVRMNNISVVKYLLSLSAECNVKDNRGLTPLHYAAQKDYSTVVKLLIKHGAIVDCECQEYFTPMFYSIAMGNYEMVKLLLSLGADIHFLNESKKCPMMPLHFAASICKFKIVQLLLEKGADVNKVVPTTGESSLHSAARADPQNNQQNKISIDCIVELLIKHKADLKLRHKYGLTPLQIAIKSKNISVAKILIVNGSELNNGLEEEDSKSYTTFHIAAKCLDRELMKVCFDYGANWAVADEEGLYPLHLTLLSAMLEQLTCKPDFGNNQRQSEQQAIFKMFWRQGFPFDLTLKMKWLDNETPPFPKKLASLVQKQKMLFKGLKTMQLSVVEKALLQGADAKCCSSDIPFPVHFIASRGNCEILKLFLMDGVNTNMLNKRGETALHLAAKEGFTHCCRLLLEYGACYNYCSPKCPKTPLKVAKTNGHSEIVTLLTTVDKHFKDLKKGGFRKLRPDMNICSDMNIFRAVINCCNRDGLTLLAQAVKLGNKKVAERLVKLRSMIDGLYHTDKKAELKAKLFKQQAVRDSKLCAS